MPTVVQTPEMREAKSLRIFGVKSKEEIEQREDPFAGYLPKR